MWINDAGALILTERVFYLGRKLNSLHTTSILKPVREGNLFLFVVRISADSLEGFGGRLRRTLGRTLLLSEMERIVEGTGACR